MSLSPSPRTLLGTVGLAALVALGALTGCGDDPLLAPTSTETTGGSYGVLGFEPPAATADQAADIDEDALDGEDMNQLEPRNPREF